jgi:hypothetical protein
LISIVSHCPQTCSLFALDVTQWLLGVLEASDGSSHPINSLHLGASFFQAMGLFGRSIPSQLLLEHTTHAKYNALVSVIDCTLSPLQKIYSIWRSEDQISDRVQLCLANRADLSLYLERLSGIIKSLAGDELFSNFFSQVVTILFEILTAITETYVWLTGTLHGAHGGGSNGEGGNDGVGGVDVFFSTSLCHIGEDPLPSAAVSMGYSKRKGIFLQHGIGDLHDTIVSCLIRLYDLNGSSQEYSTENILETFRFIKRIFEQIQSSKLIDLVTVVIRWTPFDLLPAPNSCPSSSSGEGDVFSSTSQLARHCLVLSVMKLQELPLLLPPRDQRNLHSSSLKWLLTEIESCFKLCRQVSISHFPLFLHPLHPSSLSHYPPSLIEEQELLDEYSQTILHEAFHLIDLMVTSAAEDPLLMNQPKAISSILNSLLSQRRDHHIGNLLLDAATMAANSRRNSFSHLRFWQDQMMKITVDIFIGLCYGFLSKKLQGWCDILHTMLTTLMQFSSPTEAAGERHQWNSLLCEISEKIFLSEACHSAWIHALTQQGMSSDSQHRAVLYREDGFIGGAEAGEPEEGSERVRFLSLEEAKGRFVEEFLSLQLTGPPSTTRKVVTKICSKVVRKFKIDL